MSSELMKKAQGSLEYYWGYETFLPGQDDAIRSVLEGKQTVVLFPTGGGKSLCYQVPATVFEGMTLVISPLVALMQDQVQQLKDRGIAATFINSTLSSWEVEQRLANARNGMYKLLYCAPERLKTSLWEAELPNLNIDLVAIDEAHCISEWGHDFRPSYREIRPLLEPVADSVHWIALTATATPEVRKDIIQNLAFEEANIISRGFDRPNLKWWVVPTQKKIEKLLRGVRKASQKGSGLIYGGTRRNCESIAKTIQGQLHIEARVYHAGVDPEQRKKIQEAWINGEVPLVVATNAFGMGIDKADCRYVMHFEMPYSLEAYYQEAGRAGRDGAESYPMLFYKQSDAILAKKRIKDSYPEKKHLQNVYDCLCDSLNLAVGTGLDTAKQVSIAGLQKRSNLKVRVVRSSLRVLDQLGVIQLIQNVTPQIGVQFLVSEDYICDKVKSAKNKQKAAFLDTLFRQFGVEAFGEVKYLDTDYLKRKLGVSTNSIVKGLEVLHAHDQLLNYEARGEQPLVRILEERQSKLPFGRRELEKHRNSLLKKLEYMVGFIQTKRCREVYIRSYFGEQNVEPCGHCDNCLDTGEKGISAVSDEHLEKLQTVLSEGAKSLPEIQQITKWDKEQIRKSLSFLIREQKVESESEKYRWKK